MTIIQAIGVFVGIPLLICAAITLAVYVPARRQRRRLLRAVTERRAADAAVSDDAGAGERGGIPDDRARE